jgi:hypothetical protein
VRCGTITGSGYGVHWDNGDCYVRANRIESDSNGAVWASPATEPSGKLWVESDTIVGNGTIAVYCSGDAGARVWVRAHEISGFGAILNTGLKLYVTAAKLAGTSGSTVISISGGESWITVQKITCSTARAIEIGNAAKAHIHFEEIEDPENTEGPLIYLESGSGLVRGGTLVGGTQANGIKVTGIGPPSSH